MRTHVISAVFKRNVASYFSGVLGYLFIVVFVVAGAFLAFDSEFFANNLCNLDRLSARFPLLLLFIVPAITMTAWADEKKTGTDELLFTLPARDFEILAGKYLAVLAVYSIALLFSLTHVVVLCFLGQPDWGLLFATYLGYWLSGGALLAAGMFASVLTSSSTVAFILGAAICSIPVFIEQVPGVTATLEGLDIREPLSIGGQLRDFTDGKITYSGLLYFIGVGGFFLYLNSVMIARRHWAGGQDSGSLTAQFALRVVCLAVSLLSLTYTFALAGGRLDATSERLHTLSPTTVEILRSIPDDSPVRIQAFVSQDVPQDYVPVRQELLLKLREYDKTGGKNVEVRIVDVEPYSEAAEEADGLGIQPRQVRSEDEGRFSLEDIYLGVVMTSGRDDVVIPFFDKGTPIEYELTRSIGTTTTAERKKVGILRTDARVGGGLDMQTFRNQPEWQIVSELKKQYDVTEVSPGDLAESELDVLIAILPSSLTQPEMDNLVSYVESGRPVLVFDDPVPRFAPPGLQGAPLEPKPSPGGGMMEMRQQSEPKADGGRATSLSQALGIRWDVSRSAFDIMNPHPKYAQVFPRELIFLTGETEEGEDEAACLNPRSIVTSGLQELLAFYPGVISADPSGSVDFTPLIRTRTTTTGTNRWDQITAPGFFGGRTLNPSPPYRIDSESHVIAALLEGKSSSSSDDEQNGDEEEGDSSTADGGVKAIFVADIDIVHDVMFDVWQQELYDLHIDNVVFVLNCVDYLAGDERFIELRKRRPQHRTLRRLESQKRVFEKRLSEEIRKAEEEANKATEEAKARLEEVIAELRKEMESGNVDSRAIQSRLQNATEAENRKLAQQEREIEREKNEQIRHIRIETQQAIREIERGVWRYAVAIPPLPAIILGIAVILYRLLNERRGIESDRLR